MSLQRLSPVIIQLNHLVFMHFSVTANAEKYSAITNSCQESLFRGVHASLYEGLSVGRSVRPLVGRSVPRFFLIAEIDKKQHRIIGKVETLFLDCNNLQKNFKTKF